MPKLTTHARTPEQPARSPSIRSREARHNEHPAPPMSVRERPSEGDGASVPRVQGRRILSEAVAAVPGALAAALIVVYLAWWGEEMGSRVPRGHALLLGLLGCVVVSIAAVVLGLGGGQRSGPARPSPKPRADATRSRVDARRSVPLPKEERATDFAARTDRKPQTRESQASDGPQPAPPHA
jgi:hypothetical protein